MPSPSIKNEKQYESLRDKAGFAQVHSVWLPS